MANIVDKGVALDWDTETAGDEHILLEDGYYPATITRLDRERFDGSDKVAACPRARITLRVDFGSRQTTMSDSILLNSRSEWRITKFFRALGYEKDPQTGKMKPHWNDIIDKSCYVKIKKRSYKTQDGEERETNSVAEWVDPQDHEKAFNEYCRLIGDPETATDYQGGQAAQAVQAVQAAQPAQPAQASYQWQA